MPACRNCGGFVTADFARVFGSNENEVFACPDCATFVDVASVGATGGDFGDNRVAGA